MRAAGSEPRSDTELTGEVMIGLVLVVFSLLVMVESVRMPHRGAHGFLMAPGFVPLLVGSALFLLSAVFTAGAVRKSGLRRLAAWWTNSTANPESKRLLVVMALMGLYVLVLLGRVPFFLATLVFHLLIFSYLRIGGLVKVVFYAVLASVVVAFLLPELFEMPVP